MRRLTETRINREFVEAAGRATPDFIFAKNMTRRKRHWLSIIKNPFDLRALEASLGCLEVMVQADQCLKHLDEAFP